MKEFYETRNITEQRYQCEYCNAIFSEHHECEYHEKNCISNEKCTDLIKKINHKYIKIKKPGYKKASYVFTDCQKAGYYTLKIGCRSYPTILNGVIPEGTIVKDIHSKEWNISCIYGLSDDECVLLKRSLCPADFEISEWEIITKEQMRKELKDNVDEFIDMIDDKEEI